MELFQCKAPTCHGHLVYCTLAQSSEYPPIHASTSEKHKLAEHAQKTKGNKDLRAKYFKQNHNKPLYRNMSKYTPKASETTNNSVPFCRSFGYEMVAFKSFGLRSWAC
eukprot:5614014-Amphidinium_carterae.1